MCSPSVRADEMLLSCADEVDWLLDTLPGTPAQAGRIRDYVNDILTEQSDNLEEPQIETKYLRLLADYTGLQSRLARHLDDAVIIGRLLHHMVDGSNNA